MVVFRPDADVPWELVQGESAGLSMSFQSAGGVYPSQLFGVTPDDTVGLRSAVALLWQGRWAIADAYGACVSSRSSDKSATATAPSVT